VNSIKGLIRANVWAGNIYIVRDVWRARPVPSLKNHLRCEHLQPDGSWKRFPEGTLYADMTPVATLPVEPVNLKAFSIEELEVALQAKYAERDEVAAKAQAAIEARHQEEALKALE